VEGNNVVAIDQRITFLFLSLPFFPLPLGCYREVTAKRIAVTLTLRPWV
jgi:hypothetical protein